MSNPSDETRTVKSTNAARQAVTGHNVRFVLIFGVAAAIIALAAAWIVVAGH
jgi:hypothetical protein